MELKYITVLVYGQIIESACPVSNRAKSKFFLDDLVVHVVLQCMANVHFDID